LYTFGDREGDEDLERRMCVCVWSGREGWKEVLVQEKEMIFKYELSTFLS